MKTCSSHMYKWEQAHFFLIKNIQIIFVTYKSTQRMLYICILQISANIANHHGLCQNYVS